MSRTSDVKVFFVLGVVALSSFPLLAGAQEAENRTTESGEASKADPDAECTPYSYAPVTNALPSFPLVWQPAKIPEQDANAQAKWASISPNVPDIPPKGTVLGDFSGSQYSATDPDCWWTYSKCTTPKHAGIQEDIDDVPEPSTVGYGFDDGPNCSHNAFYDFLAKQNQKATMFFIGSNVMNWPLETQRALADGHELCVHSWSHHYMTGFESEDAFAELYYSVSMQAVKLVTGVTPTCWRPPFGDVDDRIRAIADGLGLRTMLWKYDTNDWQEGYNGVTASQVDANYQAFIDASKAGTFNTEGGILLMHELDNFTMQEAMNWHSRLKDAFKYIVPVGVAYNVTNPYVEKNYTMPNFEQYTKGLTKVQANTTLPPSNNGNVNSPPPTGDAPVSTVPGTPIDASTRKTGKALTLGLDMAGGFKVVIALTSVTFGGAIISLFV